MCLITEWQLAYCKVLHFKCRPLPDMQLLSEAGKICKENVLAYFASYSEALKSFIALRHIAVAVIIMSINVLCFNFSF